jgi:hypothetical protein
MGMPENIKVDHARYHATITTVTFKERDQLLIIINILERRMGFFLSGYPAICEFMTMLKKRDLFEQRAWEGEVRHVGA